MMTKTADSDSGMADDRQKLHWEIQKLRAETEHIRRPAYLSPATLVPVVTAIAALVGVGFQYQRNALEADRAAWRKEVIEHQITQLAEEKTKLTTELATLAKENVDASNRLERIRMDLAEAVLSRLHDGGEVLRAGGHRLWRGVHAATAARRRSERYPCGGGVRFSWHTPISRIM